METEFVKYPKIKRIDHPDCREILMKKELPIVVEEKVDGANMSFWYDRLQEKVMFASRNQVLENKENAFKRGIEFIIKCIGDGSDLNKEYIYFCEHMTKHSISYDQLKIPPVLGIDILAKDNKVEKGRCGLFLGYDAKSKEFEKIDIPQVRLIKQCKLNEIELDDLSKNIPPSSYYTGDAEGVVIKCYDRVNIYGQQAFTKIVSNEFKELNRAVFGGTKQIKSDSDKLIKEMVTESRVKKQIFKLVNEDNNTLELKLMSELPQLVLSDLIQEEFKTIFKSYKLINIPVLKKLLAKKCLMVLKGVIQEEAK